MKVSQSARKIFTFVLVFILVLGAFIPSETTKVEGQTLQEQLDQLQREIRAIEGEKNEINKKVQENSHILSGFSAQASKIYSDAMVYQKEIQILEKEIEELDLNMQLLDEKIEENKKEIEKIEDAVGGLEVESTKRIKDNYKSFRLTGGAQVDTTNFFNTESINAYFKDSQYLSIIQEDTNRMLREFTELQALKIAKQKEMDEALLKVKQEKEKQEIKRADLDKKKSELDVQLASYYAEISAIQNRIAQDKGVIEAFSQQEIQKRAQADLVQQQIMNNFSPVNPGTYVAAGRMVGRQGCTGLCTGDHLHFMVYNNGALQNPCGYLKPGGPVGGCGSGSQLDWPISGTVYFTSAYGNRCFQWNGLYCDFHTGIDLAARPLGAPIYASHSGYLHKGVDNYGANYVIICQNANCNSGIKTGYWHLSSF